VTPLRLGAGGRQRGIDFHVNAYHTLTVAEVLLSAEAQRQFIALPRIIQARVTAVLGRLERWPAVSGAKPLRGSLAGHYRIRTGDYRVQFTVHVDTVVVSKIGKRDRFYED
jgi:mRNA-degrading endonuclease RelE of RelBE toxin-antitoxin system